MINASKCLSLAFAAGLAAASLAAAGPAFAKAPAKAPAASADPACKPARWSLDVPQGSSQGEAVIIDAQQNHVWRVGVGGVPGDAMLIVEYKSTVGTKGEVVLHSGAAELVEGATVTVRLKRGATPASKIAVGGTFNMKCGK